MEQGSRNDVEVAGKLAPPRPQGARAMLGLLAHAFSGRTAPTDSRDVRDSRDDSDAPPITPCEVAISVDEFRSSVPARARERSRPTLSYEAVVWAIYLAVTALAVADRFVWNVWPRQTHMIGSGSAGSDRLVGYKPGPWSVVAYDVIARVSGRVSIVALNLLMLTMMRAPLEWLASSRALARLVDTSDIVTANRRLHKWNGIALCVLTLVHVWSILLPCLTHGWAARVVVGAFEWPLSERKPPGMKDADPHSRTMSLQLDDVWRIVEMTVLLGVLAPLSTRWLATHYHVGVHVHRALFVLYFFDIVRRHTHPHSIALNAPVFALWLADKAWHAVFRRHTPAVVHREPISAQYCVVYWAHPYRSDTVGPDYRLRLCESSALELAHVFTAFENRRGIALGAAGKAAGGGARRAWTVGVVMRVFRARRAMPLSTLDALPHTRRIADAPAGAPLALHAWGPVRGEMSEAVKLALERCAPAVLVGSGSACNYLIDALQWYDPCSGCPLTILFTTRDEALLRWVLSLIAPLVDAARRAAEGGGGTPGGSAGSSSGSSAAGPAPGLRVVLALTWDLKSVFTAKARGEAATRDQTKDIGGVAQQALRRIGRRAATPTERLQQMRAQFAHLDGWLELRAGRLDFEGAITEHAVVFAQGSGAVKRAVAAECARKRCRRFYGGIGGGK